MDELDGESAFAPTCIVSLASLLPPNTLARRLLSFAAFSDAAWHSWGTAWKPLEASWGMASGVMLGSIIRLDSSPQHPCITLGWMLLGKACKCSASTHRCLWVLGFRVRVFG